MQVANKLSKDLLLSSFIACTSSSLSLSQKLLTEIGLVQFNDGFSILSPILLRPLRKLEALVRNEMKQISAVEVLFPSLVNSDLFEKSSRLNLPDLFKTNSTGNKKYILGPTYEEVAANLFCLNKSTSHHCFPVRFYQISSKFRDEKRPRCGLLRAKEFIMKDLYCFDVDEKSCEECYQEVINQYCHFFDLLQVPYVCVEGSTRDMGGLASHEFHFLSNAGQDEILLCQNCGHNENSEISDSTDICRKCQSNNVTLKTGIEVGNTFRLGTAYTKLFNSSYWKGTEKKILHMSSFGLGLTRILGATVEVLSDNENIKWPFAIAPYSVCILPPKSGSKEYKSMDKVEEVIYQIYQNLNKVLVDDIVIDDRTDLTIGKRMVVLEKLGIPILVILGKNMLSDPPTVEIIDSRSKAVHLVQIPDVTKFVLDLVFNASKDLAFKEKIAG